jgi:hypothetical protein
MATISDLRNVWNAAKKIDWLNARYVEDAFVDALFAEIDRLTAELAALKENAPAMHYPIETRELRVTAKPAVKLTKPRYKALVAYRWPEKWPAGYHVDGRVFNFLMESGLIAKGEDTALWAIVVTEAGRAALEGYNNATR